jgi:hypothetical protein
MTSMFAVCQLPAVIGFLAGVVVMCLIGVVILVLDRNGS